jgi:REP element-mobilizing transposase RayT
MEQKKPILPPRIVDPRSTPFAPPTFRGSLPHIFKDGCTYFVTFCLEDVVPIRRDERARSLHDTEPEPEQLARSFDVAAGAGACILKDPELAGFVEETLLHFQGERYALSSWCVMPNHVHAVATPLDHRTLSKIIQTWKSFSAHRINKRLARTGPVWQRESFDHLVRNEQSFEKFVSYTEANPVVAGLAERPEDWPFGSARLRQR